VRVLRVLASRMLDDDAVADDRLVTLREKIVLRGAGSLVEILRALAGLAQHVVGLDATGRHVDHRAVGDGENVAAVVVIITQPRAVSLVCSAIAAERDEIESELLVDRPSVVAVKARGSADVPGAGEGKGIRIRGLVLLDLQGRASLDRPALVV